MRKIDSFAHILPRSYLERLKRQLEKTMAPSRLANGHFFCLRVAGVPERNPVTHDTGPRRAAAIAVLPPRASRLRMASTVLTLEEAH